MVSLGDDMNASVRFLIPNLPQQSKRNLSGNFPKSILFSTLLILTLLFLLASPVLSIITVLEHSLTGTASRIIHTNQDIRFVTMSLGFNNPITVIITYQRMPSIWTDHPSTFSFTTDPDGSLTLNSVEFKDAMKDIHSNLEYLKASMTNQPFLSAAIAIKMVPSVPASGFTDADIFLSSTLELITPCEYMLWVTGMGDETKMCQQPAICNPTDPIPFPTDGGDYYSKCECLPKMIKSSTALPKYQYRIGEYCQEESTFYVDGVDVYANADASDGVFYATSASSLTFATPKFPISFIMTKFEQSGWSTAITAPYSLVVSNISYSQYSTLRIFYKNGANIISVTHLMPLYISLIPIINIKNNYRCLNNSPACLSRCSQYKADPTVITLDSITQALTLTIIPDTAGAIIIPTPTSFTYFRLWLYPRGQPTVFLSLTETMNGMNPVYTTNSITFSKTLSDSTIPPGDWTLKGLAVGSSDTVDCIYTWNISVTVPTIVASDLGVSLGPLQPYNSKQILLISDPVSFSNTPNSFSLGHVHTNNPIIWWRNGSSPIPLVLRHTEFFSTTTVTSSIVKKKRVLEFYRGVFGDTSSDNQSFSFFPTQTTTNFMKTYQRMDFTTRNVNIYNPPACYLDIKETTSNSGPYYMLVVNQLGRDSFSSVSLTDNSSGDVTFTTKPIIADSDRMVVVTQGTVSNPSVGATWGINFAHTPSNTALECKSSLTVARKVPVCNLDQNWSFTTTATFEWTSSTFTFPRIAGSTALVTDFTPISVSSVFFPPNSFTVSQDANGDIEFKTSNYPTDATGDEEPITFTYHGCVLTGSIHITYPTASIIRTQSISKALTSPYAAALDLAWVLPQSRVNSIKQMQQDPSLATNYGYVKFSLHPGTIAGPTGTWYDLVSTRRGLLKGKVSMASYGQSVTVSSFDQGGSDQITSFPESAYKVSLTLPAFDVSDIGVFKDGAFVVMSPVWSKEDDPNHQFYADGQQHFTYWFIPLIDLLQLTEGNRCKASATDTTGITCDSFSTCNHYTKRCELMTKSLSNYRPATSPLWDVVPQCSLKSRCPLYFQPNNDCTQCICISTECLTYTMSVQLYLDVSYSGSITPTPDNMLSYTIVESNLKNTLQTILGLDQFFDPNRNRLTYQNPLYTTRPNGMVTMVSIIDYLSVNIMNPIMMASPLDLSTVTLTFSFKPASTNSITPPMLKARFDAMSTLITNTVQVFQTSGKAIVGANEGNGYIVKFKSKSPPSIQFNIGTKLLAQLSTATTTRCESTITNGVYNTCPTATTTMRKMSDYWTKCTQTSGAKQPTQIIKPQCLDYVGNPTSSTSTSWCTHGWYNFPSVTSYECTGYILPTSVSWVTTPQQLGTVNSNQMVNLEWFWDPTWVKGESVEVFYHLDGDQYTTPWTTVIGDDGHANAPMPDVPNDTNIAFHLRYKSVLSKKLTVPIIGSHRCLDSPCNGLPGQYCVESTGLCECKNGYNPSTSIDSTSGLTTLTCKMVCEGHCSTQSCTSLDPFSCSKCDNSNNNNLVTMMGDLCDISTSCNNINTGLNQDFCSNKGELLHNDNDGSCTTTCKCQGKWGSNNTSGTTPTSKTNPDCNICLLTDGNITNDRCIENHTNLALTKANFVDGGNDCMKCYCLPGFYGEKCEREAVRGSIEFELASSSSLQSLQNDNNNTSGDTNGLHLITDAGKAMLIGDVGASLGLDKTSITIIKIVHNTTTPTAAPSVTSSTSSPKFNIQQSSKTTTSVQFAVTPSMTNGIPTMNDLASVWNDLQNTYNNQPIAVTETSREIGKPTSVTAAQMPEPIPECIGDNCDCDQQTKIINNGTCPIKPTIKKNQTGLIVGVIVGVVCGVALLFIGVILFVKWAKKNEKCCFVPKDRKHDNKSNKNSAASNNTSLEMESATTTTTTTITGSKTGSNTKSASAVDLQEITDHGENLPDGWSKQKHNVTGDEFYVYIKDGEMKSQKNSPLNVNGGDGDDYNDNGW